MPSIVLATLNARYAHASLGLRCLRANLGELRDDSEIVEFVLGVRAEEAVERLLADAPRIVGFGVYVWNIAETTRIVAVLKTVAPQVVVVVGGPEVSHEVEAQPICALADYVVTGWGEITFAVLARQLVRGSRPPVKVLAGAQPPLAELALPCSEFSDADLRQRHVYVEASRGCPFRCEFCLSALDRTAWPFPLDAVLRHLSSLYQRGARDFRFVDRTFNLKTEASLAILRFFLDRVEADPARPPFAHFELIPDRLPDTLKEAIARFPPGTLQLEIGIQTFDARVQALISRRQDNGAAEDNLRWLRRHTNAHLHVDLIAGLPGEDVESFGRGFDRLVALGPHEIQVGILKRLRGAPIARHVQAFGLRFNPQPPYNVLATDRIDFPTMQRLARFSRCWDLVGNSGRFARSLPLLLGDSPFTNVLAFADALHAAEGRMHAIGNERLYERLHAHLLARGIGEADAAQALATDYVASGARGKLAFIDVEPLLRARRADAAPAVPRRQGRHLRA
jgi:radical SAM superfamily enzyme YgiQ (UPF0313 family)